MMIGKGVEDINVKMPDDAFDAGSREPTFNVYLTAVVRDSEGRIIKVHRQRSHSPTANFIALFLPVSYFTSNNVSATITNATGGTSSYQKAIGGGGASIPYPNSNSSGNEPSYFLMIQVGSGSQSNPYSAYSLAAPIANGSGQGQLVYSSITIPTSITLNGNTAYFYITQTYNNISGGTITITEVGIVVYLRLANYINTTVITVENTLVWYDVLSSPISVPNAGSVTIYYTFVVNP
jgi:hypothetical protein